MIFTQEQIDEIEQKLAKRGAKDTQLPSAKTPLTGDESIAIVQERENRLVPIGSIVNTDGGIFNVSEYLKAKTEVPTSVILTLSEAIEACPNRVKKAGQIITFIDKDKEWQRYQYQGYNIENWNQLTLWKDLNNVSEDMPVSEDVMVFNIPEYMPGGSKYKQSIWAGIYTIDGNTPVSQYRLIFGCDESLGDVEGIDMEISDTLAIIDITTDGVDSFRYILFVGNSIDGYRYQTTINSDEDVPDWIEEAFGNNSSYILANITSLERRVNTKLDNKVNKVQGKGLSTNDFTNTNVSELASSINSVSYNSSTKKIIFTKNNSDTVEIDATDFVKDGMVSDVSIVGTNLVITFNTDSGKENIEIPLTDIFNPANYYTKAQVDTALSSKQDTINDLATIRGGAALGATAVQTETDPTVPSWAKQQSKPTYTATEVGALPVGTTSISDLSDGTRVDDIEDALEEKANKITTPSVTHELVVSGGIQVSDVIILRTGSFYSRTDRQIDGTFYAPSVIKFLTNYSGELRFKGRESTGRILDYIKVYVNKVLIQTSPTSITWYNFVLDVVAGDEVTVEFIPESGSPITGCVGELSITSPGVSIDLVDVYNDLENKVDKVAGKGLSTNDYTDNDKDKLTALPTAVELSQQLGNKANSADLAEVATSGSYNDLSDKPDLSGFITNSVDNLVNYYLKSETYTKTEVQQLIGAIQQFHYEVYPTLPQTGASNVLYLIGPTGSGTDKYEEYVYANNDFTKIGDTSIDLSGYVTTEALNTALADYVTSSALSTTLANYYNKTEVDGLFAGKENVMPITTATGATLTAVVGNYYRLDNVGTLAITLPTITGATKLQAITFLLACGSSALVTFAPQGSETILYQEDFALEADTTYEVTALWNGSEWTLSRVIYE